MTIKNYLHHMPCLSAQVFIDDSAQIIGNLSIGEESSVWCNAVIRADVNHIHIGHHTNIQDLTMCHVSHKTATKPLGSPLLIGNYVTIGHSVILHGCSIADYCLIGMGSIIMDDVVVNTQVIVGAGSLVTPAKELKSGFLYVGRPAVAVRELTEEEITFINYSAEHYVRLKNNYLKSELPE